MNHNLNHYQIFVQRWNGRLQAKRELIFDHVNYGIVDWICRELKVSYNFDEIKSFETAYAFTNFLSINSLQLADVDINLANYNSEIHVRITLLSSKKLSVTIKTDNDDIINRFTSWINHYI